MPEKFCSQHKHCYCIFPDPPPFARVRSFMTSSHVHDLSAGFHSNFFQRILNQLSLNRKQMKLSILNRKQEELHIDTEFSYMYFKYHDTVLYMYCDMFGSSTQYHVSHIPNSKYLKVFQVTGFRIMVFVNIVITLTYHILSNWCCPYWNF